MATKTAPDLTARLGDLEAEAAALSERLDAAAQAGDDDAVARLAMRGVALPALLRAAKVAVARSTYDALLAEQAAALADVTTRGEATLAQREIVQAAQRELQTLDAAWGSAQQALNQVRFRLAEARRVLIGLGAWTNGEETT